MAQAKRKKKFFDVDMPIIGKQTQLQAFEVSELAGRFITYDLTRVLRGKSILLQLQVKIENDKATSVPREMKLMPYFLKRMVRKGTDYVEDSFSVNCKNAEVKIKPLLVTRRRVSRNVRRALREKLREELTEYLNSKDSEKVFEDLLKNKLQKELSLKLKKIYPLSLCEVKSFKVEKELERPVEEKKESKVKDEKETSEDNSKKE